MAKESAPKKEAPTHPPYLHMITEALTSLKERTGSSVPAMAKFLEQKYGKSLPENFRKILTTQLKRLVKAERIVKVKNSFKLVSTANAKNVKTKATKTGARVTKKKKEKGGPSNDQDADKKAKVRNIKSKKENENLKKIKSAKVSEAKKVEKKAIKTKRLSLVMSPGRLNKNKGDKKVKPKMKKVGKSTSDVSGKSIKKKSAVGNKK